MAGIKAGTASTGNPTQLRGKALLQVRRAVVMIRLVGTRSRPGYGPRTRSGAYDRTSLVSAIAEAPPRWRQHQDHHRHHQHDEQPHGRRFSNGCDENQARRVQFIATGTVEPGRCPLLQGGTCDMVLLPRHEVWSRLQRRLIGREKTAESQPPVQSWDAAALPAIRHFLACGCPESPPRSPLSVHHHGTPWDAWRRLSSRDDWIVQVVTRGCACFPS